MRTINLIASICFFTLISVTTTIGQNTNKGINLLTETASIEEIRSKVLKNKSTSDRYEPFELDLAVYGVNVSKEFGSFILPSINYLKIVASDDVIYSKAQMINKETGESIFSVKLEGDKNTVDMTGTPAGVYKIILTNKEGRVYQENILVM